MVAEVQGLVSSVGLSKNVSQVNIIKYIPRTYSWRFRSWVVTLPSK